MSDDESVAAKGMDGDDRIFKNKFMSTLMHNPEFAEAMAVLKQLKAEIEGTEATSTTKPQKNSITKNNGDPPTRKRKKPGSDGQFRFTGRIPLERRTSSRRLQNKKPIYTADDLPDERAPNYSLDDSYEDLEDVVYRVKKPRQSSSRGTPAQIIPVEQVTAEMIEKIHVRGNKVYSDSGTSCHQCRQKTIDTKTNCRSGFCIGVRGQFCGNCVINRYGEDPVQALKDPNWKCYVCRETCNCSFCRARNGKRPTGILAPMAQQKGYKSVHDFLVSLDGYGDYAEPHMDPKSLLGFDGDFAVIGGKERIKLASFFEDEVEEGELLGFEGNLAIMKGCPNISLEPLP